MAALEVRLRPGVADDLDAMYRLDVECFEETFRFSRAAMRRFSRGPNKIMVVAETAAGEMAGFAIATVHRRAETAYVVTLDVAAAARRLGVGTRLLVAVEEAAAEGGLRRVELHVHSGNVGALGLYGQLGYERGAVVEDYYGDGVHAVEMSKVLAEEPSPSS